MPQEHEQPVPEQGLASGVPWDRVVVEVALHDLISPGGVLDTAEGVYFAPVADELLRDPLSEVVRETISRQAVS